MKILRPTIFAVGSVLALAHVAPSLALATVEKSSLGITDTAWMALPLVLVLCFSRSRTLTNYLRDRFHRRDP